MAKLFLGDVEIAPIVEVAAKPTLTIKPAEYEIIQNEYYQNIAGTIVSYSGWDRTSMIDLTGVSHILINRALMPGYTAGAQSGTAPDIIFTDMMIDGKQFYLYNVSDKTSIGFSAAQNNMATLIIYLAKPETYTPTIIEGEVVSEQPAVMTMRAMRRAPIVEETITYPDPSEA